MGLNISGLKDRSTTCIQNMLIQSMKKELLHMPCFDVMSDINSYGNNNSIYLLLSWGNL